MLRKKVSQYFSSMQRNLFPGFDENIGITTEKHLQVIVAFDIIQIEKYLPHQNSRTVGRPLANRDALARSFLAKSILNIPTTVGLIDRLKVDHVLRRLCGFEGKIPSQGTFSNAFAEFAISGIANKIHESLIREVYQHKLVGHVCRDATAIYGRETVTKKPAPEAKHKEKDSKRKRGRPKNSSNQSPPKELKRIEKQVTMNLEEMLADLPSTSDIGIKKNSRGKQEWWAGYKLHLDVDDNGVPLTAILTSASMHDSQAAIPLETMTNTRVTSLYSLMDAAYNSPIVEKVVLDAGKIPIIDPKKPRGCDKIPLDPAKKERYKIRTSVERTFSAIKDDYGGRYIRVRGFEKVFTHLMFGVLAVGALRLIEAFT